MSCLVELPYVAELIDLNTLLEVHNLFEQILFLEYYPDYLLHHYKYMNQENQMHLICFPLDYKYLADYHNSDCLKLLLCSIYFNKNLLNQRNYFELILTQLNFSID
jgi:hypothetical protein